MPIETRRQFARQALRSLTALALIDGLASARLFGADVGPIVDNWLKSLDGLGRDLKDHTRTDLEFQAALEELYRQVDLPALLKTLDFDRLTAGVTFPDKGAKSLRPEFRGVEGLPKELTFGRQIFAMKQGRSVIPHGHDNMSTGFLILKGDFRGRHWDRVEDHEDHYILRPTIDRTFSVGDCSSISDHKDNVHWFTADSAEGFIFNIHVIGYNPDNPKSGGRVYVDPMGEKLEGGLVKAPKITYGVANRKYG